VHALIPCKLAVSISPTHLLSPLSVLLQILIRCIFLFLDRTYVLHTSNLDSIWDMALALFREHVLIHDPILSRTVSGVLDVISRERAGDEVNRGQIKQLLGMLSELGLYKEQFEVPFLRQSTNFYEAESSQYLEQCEVADYLLYAEKKLHEERGRADQYLDDVTRKPLQSAVEMQLIIVNLDIICKGLDKMLDENRHEDLGRLYTMLGRVDGHKDLHGSFVEFIKKRGKILVGNVAKDKTMVEDLLEFKQTIDNVVIGPWQKNALFINGVREAFAELINSRHNKPAEMIAQFFDAKLRTGYKELSEEKMDETFDRVIILFRFINGKDVFEAFYKTHLARRLLLQKSSSNDAERSILSKLKQECGSQFTGKLEGMFKDVHRSTELTSSFKQGPGAKFGTEHFDGVALANVLSERSRVASEDPRNASCFHCILLQQTFEPKVDVGEFIGPLHC
jgi:cullin 4